MGLATCEEGDQASKAFGHLVRVGWGQRLSEVKGAHARRACSRMFVEGLECLERGLCVIVGCKPTIRGAEVGHVDGVRRPMVFG